MVLYLEILGLVAVTILVALILVMLVHGVIVGMRKDDELKDVCDLFHPGEPCIPGNNHPGANNA